MKNLTRNILKIIIALLSFFNKFSTVFLFQFIFIITPLTKIAGIIIGKKTKLKYKKFSLLNSMLKKNINEIKI